MCRDGTAGPHGSREWEPNEVDKMATRLFLMGVVLLFFGLQLRAIKTFVLNDQASQIVNKRIGGSDRDVLAATSYDYYYDSMNYRPEPARRAITPPRWLGWSLLSVGAVLVLTCPCFR